MERLKTMGGLGSLMLTLVLGSGAPAHAGIPVIDAANLTQSIIQAMSWIQQLQAMRTQITQANAQITAITGSRNMGSLLNNAALAGVVPSDVNAVYNAIHAGGISGLTSAAQIMRNSRMLYNCTDRTGEALRICQNLLNTNAQSQANYANTLQMLEARMLQIRGLTTRINATTDEKDILELNARIAAETAQVQNDGNRIQTMKAIADAQAQAADQEARERALRMLSPTAPRTFNTLTYP